MLRTLAVFAASLALSACLANGAREIDAFRGRLPTQKAMIVFALVDEHFAAGRPNIVVGQFDEFDLGRSRITGNCARYNRLPAEAPAEAGQLRYFAFEAPAGHYVWSPGVPRTLDESAQAAFLAPAGAVTYLGDFISVGEDSRMSDTIVRRENLAAAAAFARGIGLPEPSLAQPTPVDFRGPPVLCTP